MRSQWQGWAAALVATLLTAALVTGDVTDDTMRRWWLVHALTTSTVSGLLVLLITVLVVNQVLVLRQIRDRARAVAAQAAIILSQAVRAARSATQAAGDGAADADREAAGDELRTYMMMLLVGAPVLIDETVSRAFLEQAQAVGALLARSLGMMSGAASVSLDARLDGAVQKLQAASVPLLAVLDAQTRAAVRGNEPGS